MTQLEKKERESRRLVPALDLLSQNLRKGAGLGFIFAQWGWLPVNGAGSSGALQVREVRGVDLPKVRGREAGPEKAWIFFTSALIIGKLLSGPNQALCRLPTRL